jgi:hypothetical protein
MANLIFKNETIKLDNAAGTLTDITPYLTSETLTGIQDLIEQSSMSMEEKSYLFGQAGATMQIAGFVNSTMNGILGPLIGNRTTATKTFQRAATTNIVHRGEVLVSGVEYSGSVNTIQTFSFNATFDGVMISTSVAL